MVSELEIVHGTFPPSAAANVVSNVDPVHHRSELRAWAGVRVRRTGIPRCLRISRSITSIMVSPRAAACCFRDLWRSDDKSKLVLIVCLRRGASGLAAWRWRFPIHCTGRPTDLGFLSATLRSKR